MLASIASEGTVVFVDTGAWIALTDHSDQYHLVAAQIYGQLKQRRELLVTTDYVLDETLTRLRYDAGHTQAMRFLELIEQSQRAGVISRVRITDDVFESAVGIFRQYTTVALSFTDCTSFVVCRRHAITEAFAFDQHFLMFGLTLSTV